ncbi:hypothetical protein SDC9_74332 [bioreactor metagenome]|uniref:Uncharacterized protein n=1 Tax=bioreactor metagenome TaxID=1076179 RepID=A0A644YII2_9ZZZZ
MAVEKDGLPVLPARRDLAVHHRIAAGFQDFRPDPGGGHHPPEKPGALPHSFSRGADGRLADQIPHRRQIPFKVLINMPVDLLHSPVPLSGTCCLGLFYCIFHDAVQNFRPVRCGKGRPKFPEKNDHFL